MKPIVIRRKRSGQAVILFCSVMVFVFFLFLIFSAEIPERYRGFFAALGWVGTGAAGVNLLLKIRRTIHPRALLIANEDGLCDFSTPAGLGFVSWEETGEIQLFSVHGEQFVGVEIPRVREIMEQAGHRYTAAQKNAVKSNLSLGYPPMLIQLLPSGEDPSSMADFLKDYKRQALLEKQKASGFETGNAPETQTPPPAQRDGDGVKEENSGKNRPFPPQPPAPTLRLAFPRHSKKG